MTNTTLQTISQNIKTLRRSQGLSQQDLAKKMGITAGYVSGFESGSRNLSIDVIDKIADALNVSTEFLVAYSSNIKNIKEILSDVEWDIQGFNGHPFYLLLASAETGFMCEEAFYKNYKHFFYLFKEGKAQMYYDKADWKAIGDSYYQHYVDIEEVKALIANHTREFIKKRKEVKTLFDRSIDAMNEEELISFAQEMKKLLVLSVTYAHSIEGITYVTEQRLREGLMLRHGLSEAQFSILCSPVGESHLMSAQKYVKGAKQQKIGTHNILSSLQKEYSWIGNSYLGSHKITAQDIEELNLSTNLGLKSLKKEKADLLKNLKLSSGEKFMISSIELLFSWQDERKTHILETIDLFDSVMSALARRIEISRETIMYLMPNELQKDFLLDNNFIQELEERRKGCAVYCVDGKYSVITGSQFITLNESFGILRDTEVDEFKGQSASTGKVTGRVKICESVSDIEKVEEGEILVASMTRPEYMLAINKAVGIITNEGGITCHAAIVSRELGIPCVIGTKIATQALSDGDLVELDANTGIVTILKREKRLQALH